MTNRDLCKVIEDLKYQVMRQNEELVEKTKRIRELENGACRFNCRKAKDAFYAGYEDGFSEGFWCEDNPGMAADQDDAYIAWCNKGVLGEQD